MDKKILGWLLAVVLAVIGLVVSKPYWASLSLTNPWGTVSDTTRVTVVDTVPYLLPVAVDSVVVRYELAKLPIDKGDKPYYASLSLTKPRDTILTGNYAHKSAENIPDSVQVELPITQKRYGDSTYTAWVSGYKARLDSIYVYPRHETITITNTIRQKPRRWGLGVSAGYGYAPGKGMVPWVGVGVNYTLISF